MTSTARLQQAARIRRTALALAPALVVAGVIMFTFVGAPGAGVAILGAAGWLVALMLRQPVAVLTARWWGPDRARTIVGASSGPAEELVRVILVLTVIRSAEDAAWAGFGWGAIELVMVLTNTLLIARLITKDDPKSLEAREALEAQGMLTHHGAGWALLERLSAFGLHVGFTLLLFAQPWLLLLTAPAHTLTNLLAVRLATRSIALTEVGLGVFAAGVLTAGIALSV